MIDTTDYLKVKEKEIFDRIWSLGESGEMADGVKLKALCKLYDKIRPDKKQIDLEFDGKSPYEAIQEQFKKLMIDDGK
jgi:hypothetical protein